MLRKLRSFSCLFKYTSSLKRKLCIKTSRIVGRQGLSATAYQPKNVEKNKYEKWEKEGLYSPSFPTARRTFGMVLPPPNVTGKLHLGHALGCTIQDVILRRHQSLGFNCLWVPGLDHAGIATQTVVEKHLKNTSNLQRQDMNREEFNDAVLKWKNEHGSTIKDQLKRLGCALDWSREVFTMDTRSSLAVNRAFIELFQKGLIYRKKALVNWSPALQSTVSDIEVDNLPIKGETTMTVSGYSKPVQFGRMYSFAYKIFGSNEELVVSTTMPETLLGDVAVAVNPNDARYIDLQGKRLYHPFKDYTIPVIYDQSVDMKFGTGAVKVTPAHSKVDYEIARRHNLPIKQVIDEKRMMMNSGEFSETHKYACREKIITILSNLGFLRDIKPHEMVLPICSRTGDIIEYLPMEQWFVSCKRLNERARDAVSQGKLVIEPEKYLHNWSQWTSDDKDWCISRQLWWGHQIPAYKCTAGKNLVWVAANSEKEAKLTASKVLRTFPEEFVAERDPDVLDTWFSSGIYPFAALGWPDKTNEIESFYPLNMMVTGHDILGFWVHRMVMLGLELTDKLPFERVLLHGIICDSKGAKMSKSKGNVIDPMDVIQGISIENLASKTKEMHKNGILTKDEVNKALQYHKSNFSNTNGIPECGADALRFTLLSQDIKSHFVNFDVNMCHANKLFCNKIWQSVKYAQMNIGKLKYFYPGVSVDDLTPFDRWILSRLSDMVTQVNKHMEEHDFHLATKALRRHIYNEFCDVYIEATKAGFGENDLKTSYAHAHTVSAVLHTALRCLHPFMVFVTDELIPQIPTFEHNIIYNYDDSSLKYYDFPRPYNFEKWQNYEVENRVGKMLDAVSLARELKSISGMSNAVRPALRVFTPDEQFKSDLVANLPIVLNLARCSTLELTRANEDKNEQYIRAILDNKTEVFVQVVGTDYKKAMAAVKKKLEKNIANLTAAVKKLEEKFASAKYIESTSEWTKVIDREKLSYKQEKLKKITADLRRLYHEEPDIAEETNLSKSKQSKTAQDDLLKQ